MSVGDRFHTLAGRCRAFCGRFGDARRGNVALMFALSLPLLLMVTLGGIDLHRASTVRGILQDALDAATLSAARSKYVTDAEITEVGMASLQANLSAYYPEIDISQEGVATFRLDGNGAVIANVELRLKTIVASIVLPPYGKFMDDYLPIDASSEVLRSSRNVEVALVLDITGSMDNCTRNCPPVSKIEALKTAAKDLVGIVVQPIQTPFYSKMAIVPYSMGVNVGDYAPSVRGAITGSTAVTNVTWAVAGTTKTITGVTRANPAVVTASNHGYANGDRVAIWNASGMTQLNGRVFEVANRTTNTFQLRNFDTRNYNALNNPSGNRASVAKCSRTDCYPTMTSSGHGLSNGESVYLTNIGGMSQLNDESFTVGNVSGGSFTLATVGGGVYSSGGQAFCARTGCQWKAFTNAEGNRTNHQVSTCVSERTGSQAYTDASPTSARRVGLNYPSTSNPCPAAVLRPLTDDVEDLEGWIDDLEAVGSTAGHIGLAWGWYTVSPNFGVWSGDARPGAVDPSKLLKVVILMTDGEFNTPYFDGVISRDAGVGSGGANTHINQDATNGDPFSQAVQMCAAIRAQGVVIYTVGFSIPDVQDNTSAVDTAEEVLEVCASSDAAVDRSHIANSNLDLSEAFAAVGRDITQLRISK